MSNGGVSQTVLNREDEHALRGIVKGLGDVIDAKLASRDFGEAADMVRRMEYIEKVDNVLVTRLLSLAKGQVSSFVRSLERDAYQSIMMQCFDKVDERLAEMQSLGKELQVTNETSLATYPVFLPYQCRL